jgi:hypothetical protein
MTNEQFEKQLVELGEDITTLAPAVPFLRLSSLSAKPSSRDILSVLLW